MKEGRQSEIDFNVVEHEVIVGEDEERIKVQLSAALRYETTLMSRGKSINIATTLKAVYPSFIK